MPQQRQRKRLASTPSIAVLRSVYSVQWQNRYYILYTLRRWRKQLRRIFAAAHVSGCRCMPAGCRDTSCRSRMSSRRSRAAMASISRGMTASGTRKSNNARARHRLSGQNGRLSRHLSEASSSADRRGVWAGSSPEKIGDYAVHLSRRQGADPAALPHCAP